MKGNVGVPESTSRHLRDYETIRNIALVSWISDVYQVSGVSVDAVDLSLLTHREHRLILTNVSTAERKATKLVCKSSRLP